ncbi:ALP1-like protein [Tanacetum coccineum]
MVSSRAVVELTLRVTINNGRRREVKYRQSQEVLVDIPERIIEHGLSSKITQSSGGSSDMSEGSENSGSFEDYGSSDREHGLSLEIIKPSGSQIRARGPKTVGASRIMEDQRKIDALISKCLVTINNGRRREVKYRQSQEVLVNIPERITEHGLTLEITQSPGGSSNTSEGSKISGSFEDYGRSDKDCALRTWSNNDINILRQSPVLNDLKVGKAPEVPFVANGVNYKWGYDLTGGIYPEWSIVRTPAWSRSLKRITHLMYTCIILHNMIRKEKGNAISPDFYLEEQHREDDPVRSAQDRLRVIREIHDEETHLSLKADLVKHIWHRTNEH